MKTGSLILTVKTNKTKINVPDLSERKILRVRSYSYHIAAGLQKKRMICIYPLKNLEF